MKKVILLLCVALLLLGMTACGGNPETPDETAGQVQTQGQQNPAPTQAQDTDAADEPWGVDGSISTRKNKNTISVSFKWPHYYGKSAKAGEAADQLDGTFVLVDRYKSGSSPEDVELKDFYPAYLEQTVASFADFYGNYYKNGAITVGNGELETIGEYEVCKYSGKHTYELEGKSYEHQIVVYATVVKKNESLIYWLVEDITEDQSAGQLIREHAEKIIQSIQEN